MVRDTGFEPVTPSVSRKCSTTELTAQPLGQPLFYAVRTGLDDPEGVLELTVATPKVTETESEPAVRESTPAPPGAKATVINVRKDKGALPPGQHLLAH